MISSFGHPVTSLTSDGARLMIYDSEQEGFFLGASSAENIARLISLQIDPSELSSLLRGTIPKWPGAESRVEWNSSRGRYVLLRLRRK